MKIHNFSAGPSILPEFTIKRTAEALINFSGTGLSVAEVSHRSKEFVEHFEQARGLVREILEVPDTHEILFLQGGASTQFLYGPMNLLKGKAAYIDCGVWAKKALKEAQGVGEVVVVGSSADDSYSYIPKDVTVPSDVDYYHFCSNNTISGTQFKEFPNVDVPLVADMSSDIFSRKIDFTKFDLVYAGAQKNLAPSGFALVIVRSGAIENNPATIPTMVDYRSHIKAGSMFNTPPTVAIYAALQTLKWIKERGGVEALQKANRLKAELLYQEIDSNLLFEGTVKDVEDRSEMNVTFTLKEEYKEHERAFLTLCDKYGISGIKGHRMVGGFRASIYNAMPISSVQVLVDAMKEFAKVRG